ncbi:MAG: hypothetical protein JZU55_15435 [Afipia sp.]|nr:hypothetical protein [Afipia sp.]
MLEQQDVFGFGDRRTIQADLDRVLMMAFGRALDVSGLMPMAVMNVMANAFGTLYRQVAEQHQNQPCPCGWQPTSAQDIELLKSALEAAAKWELADKLLTMPALGRA